MIEIPERSWSGGASLRLISVNFEIYEPLDYDILDHKELSRAQFLWINFLACRLIMLTIADDLVDTIAEHTDPAKIWAALKEQFLSGDKVTILSLVGEISTLKITEGESIIEFIKKARELQNRLISMGHALDEKHLNQIILNGLLCSYDGIV